MSRARCHSRRLQARTLHLTLSGKGTGSGTITGTMAFDRKDYGMTSGIPFIRIADRVEVRLNLKGTRERASRRLQAIARCTGTLPQLRQPAEAFQRASRVRIAASVEPRCASLGDATREASDSTDLVVKLQAVDIFDVVLWLIIRQRIVYRREIKERAALTLEAICLPRNSVECAMFECWRKRQPWQHRLQPKTVREEYLTAS